MNKLLFTMTSGSSSKNLQTHNNKSSTSSLCTLTKSLWASNSCVYLVRNIINDYNSMSSPVVAGCDGTKSFLTGSVPLEKADPIIINFHALKYRNLHLSKVQCVWTNLKDVMVTSMFLSDRFKFYLLKWIAPLSHFSLYLQFAALSSCHPILWFVFSTKAKQQNKNKIRNHYVSLIVPPNRTVKSP